MRGDRNSRSAISALLRPRPARMTISRCCAVSPASAPGWPAGVRGHAAGAQFGFRAPGPRRRAQAPERFQSVPEDGLGVVDPPLASQPLAVVQLKLSPLERPRAPRGIGQRRSQIRLGVGRLGEQSAGPGRELFQPRPGRGVHEGQRSFQERPGFQVPFGARRGGGEVGDGEVGERVVQRRAVGGEELAELRVGGHVVALGDRGEARGVPGPGGEPPVFGRVDGGEHPGQQRCYPVGVTAHGGHGGRGQVGRAGDGFHLVGGGDVARLAGGGERLVPASAVDAGPFQRPEHAAAGAADAGGAQPAEGFA